jgi:hypothetical protein
MKNEGFWKTRPIIKKLSFKHRGKINLLLEDGREIIIPLKYFPSIKKLNMSQRKYYTIISGEGIALKDANEVFHIQDFLGKEQEYRYAG